MQSPKPNPKTLKGPAAIKQYQKETSPQGVAKRDAEIKRALEKKYPGLYLPETRITPGVRRP